MKAAILRTPAPLNEKSLKIEDIPMPIPGTGHALLKIRACGVCRTDLHIVEGELPTKLDWVVPGHQVVAEIIRSHDPSFRKGDRVGISWIGGTDGSCRFCLTDRENLCDHPSYTGYTQNGGFAEYMTARTDFLFPLPHTLEDHAAAPLLCAGIIGFRSLKIAEVKRGQHVGLFGFGSSAQLLLQVLKSWDCRTYVSTRELHHQQLARTLGAEWVGGETEVPPKLLDSAITFAPSGDVVVAALRSVDKGGIVAINAIHLDRIPQFDYDSLLWGERQLRSVTNMTRQDGIDFLKVASEIDLKPAVVTFRLDQINEALLRLKEDRLSGPAVIIPSGL